MGLLSFHESYHFILIVSFLFLLDSKYGPMPTFPHQRVWSRMVIIIAVMIIVYFASNKGKKPFALQRDIVQLRTNFTECSLIHQSIKSRPGEKRNHCFFCNSLWSSLKIMLLLHVNFYKYRAMYLCYNLAIICSFQCVLQNAVV